ncbi:hypothetical protein QTP88_024263 [Uroleucon formosanum]
MEDVTKDFRKLSIENVQGLQQSYTAREIEIFMPNIKPVLSVLFLRLINVDVIEEKSPRKIRIPMDRDLSSDIDRKDTFGNLRQNFFNAGRYYRFQECLFTNH